MDTDGLTGNSTDSLHIEKCDVFINKHISHLERQKKNRLTLYFCCVYGLNQLENGFSRVWTPPLIGYNWFFGFAFRYTSSG